MATPGTKPPHFMGIRDVGDGVAMTLVLIVQFNGVRFSIVAADPDDDGVGQALVPAAQTLQDHLHPQVHTLQILTEGDKITCRSLDNDDIPPEN